MWAVCKKELRQFFSSLTGYIAIIVFLLLNGLLLFVFPDTDILAFGYATLDKFFELAPWILLLLIPAITMRSLSEEFRMGTFEILQTTPLSRNRLVGGKYLASLIVMLIALLPTLIYFLSIQRLSGQGGIDTGATTGSYIGLVFLAAVFTAIGTWCSSFTSNAVVAFLVAAFACFLLYSGFNAISGLAVFAAGADYYIEMLGIDFHYRSISRGVIDSRDLVYFFSIILLFLYLTNRQLEKRKALLPAGFGWFLLLLVLVGLNWVAASWHYRLDLTAEKRYTLSNATRNMLARVDEDIEIDFFLEGDLKSGIRKLSKGAQELLQEFNEYSGGKIRVHAFDPLAVRDDSAKAQFLDSLRRLDIQPMTQVSQSKKGEAQSQRVIIPGAILRYKNSIYPIDLLKGVQRASKDGQPEEQLYTNAETLLEYKFGSAIDRIIRQKVPVIGYVMGNGEPLDYRVYSLIQGLRSSYRFGIVALDSMAVIPDSYNVLIIVKPTKKFTDREKLTLDQYLLHGGQLIWAVDNLYAEMDSLSLNRQTVAYDRGLELEDLFFRYGVRINQDLVEDMQCIKLNMVVGMQGGKPQFDLLSWPYFPLLNGSLSHPISKNLDPVYSKFANSVESVNSPGIAKTVLLQTSDNARTVSTPAMISLESVKQAMESGMFKRANIPVAMLLEGKFRSLYANRVSRAMVDSLSGFYHQPFLPEATTASRVVVCADADIVMNDMVEGRPLPLGYSKDNDYTFANESFIDNCVEFLVNPSGILETRAKDYTLRLLDPAKVEKDRPFWQFINIGLPLILVVLGGYLYQLLRKKRYQL
jgi:ABC-2 type transport system permease protein